MDESRATRADLLARKSQAALAQQGAKLLESKREALLKELMGLIRPLVDAYAAIPEVAQHAGRSLALSQSVDGTAYLSGTALLASDRLRVQHENQAFWGIQMPELSANVGDTLGALDRVSLSAGAVETAHHFRELVAALLEAAPLQVKLTRLGLEIRKTSRRVNALDQVVIPNLKRDIATISQALEEIEREDLFRLRRIKKKKEAAR